MIEVRKYLTPWRTLLIAIVTASGLAPACSGSPGEDGGGGGGGYDEALASYRAAASERADAFAALVAPAYLQQLTTGTPDPESPVLEQYKDAISEASDSLCQGVAEPAEQAGSGDIKQRRLDGLFATSRQIVQDAVASALLNGALAAAPERRDQLLDLLGVKATAPDGTPLRGADAIRVAGLDPQSPIDLPQPGTPEYTKYRDWVSAAAGFEGAVISLTDDIRGNVESCINSR
jgi:hypothetical protein